MTGKNKIVNEPLGYLQGRIILNDDNLPVDYLVLEHNETISKMLKTEVDDYKRASEIFDVGWAFSEDELEIFSSIALNGTNAQLQVKRQNSIFTIHAYAPRQNHFTLLVSQVVSETSLKKQPLLKIIPNSRRLLEITQELANIGTWVYYHDARTIEWSEETCRIYGISPTSQNLTFDSYMNFIPAEEHEEIKENFFKSVREGLDFFELEHSIIHRPDGAKRYLHQKCFHEKDSSGRIFRSYGLVQDVTEKKLAGLAMLESRNYLENILRVAPVGIGVAKDRRFIVVNPAFCKLTKYSMEELIGDSSKKLFLSDETYEKISDDILQQIENERYASVETQWKRKDNSIIDVYIAASPFEKEDLSQGIAITVKDITHRKQSERLMKARIRLMSYSNEHTVQHLLKFTIEEVENITSSHTGFFHLVNEDKQVINLQEWSTQAINNYHHLIEQIPAVIPLSDAGYWSTVIQQKEPVVYNYDSSQRREIPGLPGTEVFTTNEMLIPITRNNKVVALLGIGNKQFDYTAEDVVLATKLAELAWDIADRKQVREALKKSEKLYRQLFDNMTQGFALYDIIRRENNDPIDYRYIAANPAFEVLTGLQAEEIIGKTMNEFFPQAEGYWYETFRQVTITGQPLQFENYFKALNKYFNLWIFKPDPNQIAVIFTDVTEQKKAEEKILKLTKGIEQSPAVVLITDTKGNIEYVNPKFTEISGYTAEEAIGRKPSIQKSGLHGKDFYRNMWRTILSGEDWTGIIANKKKSGELYWESVIISPVKDDEGVIKNFISIKENITRRVMDERSLKNSERKYRLIFENVPVGIFYLSKEGIITDCNQNFISIIGSSREKLIGLDFLSLPDKRITSLFEEITRGQTAIFEGDYSSVTANKTTSVRVLLSPVINDKAEVEGAIGLVEDRTVQEKQQRLEKQVALAREAIEFKQNFLANMSHEIRTPLTGIIGMLDIMKETNLDQSQKEYLSIMENTSENLMEIVNQVLDFSKIEAGKLKIYIRDFDLRRLIEEKVNAFNKISKKEVEILSFIDENVPTFIGGDKGRLSQVINNLMNNAIKFTEKGSITIRAELLDQFNDSQKLPGEITLNKPVKLKISITDTGIGISNDRKVDLFDPFTQLHTNIDRTHTGTGLGLAICRQLVEMHGGEIGFTSQLGIGSTFYFTFLANVCQLQDQKEEISANEDITHKISGMKILMAEDKQVNQKVFYIILRSMGFNVTFTSNGKELLEIFNPGMFDLILMDIQMPVMDGITATQKLRELYDDLPPIIGLSANAFEGDREKYMIAGMDEYITKPFKPVDLIAALQKLNVI